ncbi:MAG: hypothetical protein LAQ30_23530 [Acidobacteriia bacterium]|nr:hypothetical protein [Terriglobia bacterium]
MTRAVRFVLGLIFQNFWWKALSLAIAFGIWAMVATEPEMETSLSVPMEYRDLPTDIEISDVTPSNNIVSLELRGPSLQLRELGQNGGLRPGVVLDMSHVQPGQRTFTIGGGDVRLPRGVHLVWARPSVVRFDFDWHDRREVPVSVRFTGEGENGYEISQYSVSPERLAILGPRSHVERVKTVATDAVDVSHVVGMSEFRVNAFVNDSYVRFESSPEVTVSVMMKKK